MFWITNKDDDDKRGIDVFLGAGGYFQFSSGGCCDRSTQTLDYSWDDQDKKWHHFAFIKDGKNKEIYIDGKLVKKGVNTTPLFKTGWEKLYFGQYYRGSMKDNAQKKQFAIWKTPLTAADIKKLATGTTPL